MPSPPPAPRRARPVRPGDWPSRAQEPATQRAQGQAAVAGRASVSGFDSSDDILLGGDRAGAQHPFVAGNIRRDGGDNNSSFTFADARPAGMLPSAAAGPSRLFANSDELISKLTGGYRGGMTGLMPSSDFSVDLKSSSRFAGASLETPGLLPMAGPSKGRVPQPARNRLSDETSSFRASPRPLRGGARHTHAMPSTPLGAAGHQPSGLNADGSFSVVRDEDEANNSGLLELGPLSSFGRQADLFGLRKFRGLQAKSREGSQENAAAGSVGSGRSSRGTAAAKTSSSDAANGSVVEHSILSEVPESDELEMDAIGAEGSEGNQQLLQRLRLWRQDAMEHHLYDTAIFWGEKVLCMETQETQRPNDAYFLAKAYFLTHQYSRAEHLLVNPLPPAAAPQLPPPPPPPGDLQRPMQAEDIPDEDALAAALEGARRNTVLPASLIQRSAGKSGFNAGVLHSDNERADAPLLSDDDFDGDAGTEKKRKDREFTVSGTGTGSESNGGEIDSDGAADGLRRGYAGRRRDNAASATTPPLHEPRDFRKGINRSDPLRPSPVDLSMPLAVYEAWTAEQDTALQHIRAQSQPLGSQRSVLGQGGAEEQDASNQPLVNISSACRYLAAKCRVCLGRFGEALDLIGEESGRWIKGGAHGRYGAKAPSSDGLLKVASSVTHLRGLIQLRLDNLNAAREAFIEALRIDVKNYDAFAALVDGKLLSGGQVWNLVEGLEWEAQSNGDKQSFDFIRLCYMSKLDKEEQGNAVRAATARRELWSTYGGAGHQGGLYNSTDLLHALAEDLYARRRFTDALIVTRRILSLDAEHEQTIDLHIGCIASLPPGQAKTYRPQLYLLANRLVEEHPDRASSWFAAGTWYATSQRWAEARKYFSKATLLNPRHLPCWLSFAHSFSLEGESEQAVLAYSSVVKTFPNVRYAKVCLGSEHLRMGNLKLARTFLEGARDPLGGGNLEMGGEEEMGVLRYYEGRFAEAITILSRVLQASSAAGEPSSSHLTTRLNLAWALCKGEQADEARRMFRSVIEIDSTNVAAHLGLAMVDHRAGRLADAVGWYHDALAIDPRHPQATELLQVAMEEYASLPIEDEGIAPPSKSGAAGRKARLFEHLELPPEYQLSNAPAPGLEMQEGVSLEAGESSVMDVEGDEEEQEVSEETRPVVSGTSFSTGQLDGEESVEMDETG
ncbi:TPR-like protein [Microstroma glucosiphilum]|uniref:TPR-like protein n=1 Tax=Pseudomicrostroma glucosiphilum TaxID=1684307 RepID=A0A316UB56_9BASI|nr:TPR-like protein [Pseudomicrostroma glucosiphilum]PWN22456.1 TPR-like protein [Pseudomicrostroma glucosiphilum]